MKKTIMAVSALCMYLHATAQNQWDGSTTSTVTTNGKLGIGSAVDLNFRATFSNTDNTIQSGIENVINNTYSLSHTSQYGIFNQANFLGALGNKYGIFNTVTATSPSASITGFYNFLSAASSTAVYGMQSSVTNSGAGYVYGDYINVAGNSTGVKYGVYSAVNGGSGAKYGVYASAGATGSEAVYGLYATATGSASKAAFFQGATEMRGNQILTTNNQSRFVFHTSWLSGPIEEQWVTIAPNNTSGSDDWDFQNALTLYNGGLMEKTTSGTGKAFSIKRADLSKDVFRVLGDGKVYATEVNVMLYTAFPDYVFQPSYKLMPLKDVDTYIQENGHLPNVPDAATVAEEGINLGDMTKTLVEKVEELTLYMIAQQKVIEQQQAQINDLKALIPAQK